MGAKGGGERGGERWGRAVKALLQLANFTLDPDAILNTKIHKNLIRIKAPNTVNASKRKLKNRIYHKDEYSWLILLCARVNQNQ